MNELKGSEPRTRDDFRVRTLVQATQARRNLGLPAAAIDWDKLFAVVAAEYARGRRESDVNWEQVVMDCKVADASRQENDHRRADLPAAVVAPVVNRWQPTHAFLKSLTDEDIARLNDAAKNAPDGTVTMMFTDIVSSSEIPPLLGETEAEQNAAWIERFQTPHHEIIRACLKEFEGFEVKTIGDAFFVTFADAANAVRCGVEIQRRLTAANLITPLEGNPPLQVRIGIHTGTPKRQGNDYAGGSVNKAARVESAARGGQVLISEETHTLVRRQLPAFTFHPHGEFLLKGLGLHALFEVLWEGKAAAAPNAAPAPKETHDEPLDILIPADFLVSAFASQLETLRTAARPDPMRPQEWQKACETVDERWLEEFGWRLFAYVFEDEELERRYWETTGEIRLRLPADGERHGVRSLQELPFELLHDGTDFVALRRGVVRVVEVDKRSRRPRNTQHATRMKVLVALSAPVLDTRLKDPNHELQPHVFNVEHQADIFRNLEGANFPATFHLLPHATKNEFNRELMRVKPQVLHFVGHGGEGTLLFETRHGESDVATRPEIERYVNRTDSLQLVVLESCLTAARGVDGSSAAMTIYDGLGQFFQIRSYWSDDVTSLQLILDAAERAPDADTPDGKRRIGVILNNLDNVYRAQGQYAEAEACYQQSLAIKREFGDRVGEGKTLENLALLREAQG